MAALEPSKTYSHGQYPTSGLQSDIQDSLAYLPPTTPRGQAPYTSRRRRRKRISERSLSSFLCCAQLLTGYQLEIHRRKKKERKEKEEEEIYNL